MNQDRLTEFITVLAFALIVGAGVMLAFRCLGETARNLALIGLLVVSILSWQYLRKRFGRNR